MTADVGATPGAAAHEIAERLGVERHDVAIVLGSGWGPAADELGDLVAEVPMASLPGFAAPVVGGHPGVVRSVRAGGRRVLALVGRVHLYEGHSAAAVVHGVRTAVAAGCGVVVLTNAAGSLRADLRVGSPVLVADHVNLTGRSPLVGPAFVDMVDAYSPRLRALARSVEPSLPEGVYAGLAGPQYETPAEIRMLQVGGADLVGMSTVLETIAARHAGAEVLGMSLVTNVAAGLSEAGLDHAEVLAAGRAAAPDLGRLLRRIVERL